MFRRRRQPCPRSGPAPSHAAGAAGGAPPEFPPPHPAKLIKGMVPMGWVCRRSVPVSPCPSLGRICRSGSGQVARPGSPPAPSLLVGGTLWREGVRRPQALSEPRDQGAPLTWVLSCMFFAPRTLLIPSCPRCGGASEARHKRPDTCVSGWGGRRVLRRRSPPSDALMARFSNSDSAARRAGRTNQ